MGEYEHKIATLREHRAEAVATLDAIERSAPVMRDGKDISEQRRQHLQNVILTLDAAIIAYEEIDADRT